MAGALLGRAEQMQAERRQIRARENRAGLHGGSKKRTVI
jgi:hypothetical protein